jgi:hypothetical protein
MVLFIGTLILSQSTVKSPHGSLQWDCQDCHTAESWSKMCDTLLFDHAATGYVLIGAHAVAGCVGCHRSPVFSNVAVSCIDCHADHHNGDLGADCQRCHTPQDWQNRQNTLELHVLKGFALTGIHAVADCEACHVADAGQEYTGTPVECYDCHAKDYAATEEPNHLAAGIPFECIACHRATVASWLDADFDHLASFPLTGGHQSVACRACHPSGYVATPTECYSCHDEDYAATADPNHAASGFTTDCTECHTIAGWQPAHYNHNATAFPLTGAHLQVNCVACHTTQYAGTPTDCFACHQTDFDQSSEPNHQLAGFDHNCTGCHATTAWEPSLFDHSTTGYTLTGRHLTAACSSCHGTSYPETPSDCYSCHQTAYEGTTNPSHASAGFPTECQNCHSTAAWTPSSWDHDGQYFPIYSGTHNGRWDACSDCHVNPASFATFECINCHEHNQTDTDLHHNEVQNYQYLSTACYSCHPAGRH